MSTLSRALAAAGCTLSLATFAPPVAAQCPAHPENSFYGGQGFDGDEPDDFTHYVDADGDGLCDFTGDANGDGFCNEPSCRSTVAWDAANGVHPNGTYPDCMQVEYEERTHRSKFILQRGHAHYEYTHLQTDQSGNPEEKDYLAITQAMQTDFQNGDTSGTATRAALEQSLRFLTGEPERFERFLLLNPNGRYWQVDEWIGPCGTPPGPGGPVCFPGLTWTERFFACGDERGLDDCARVNGTPAFGGYWSDHAEQFGYQGECGEPEIDDPEPELDDPVDPDGRNEACGILFRECQP